MLTVSPITDGAEKLDGRKFDGERLPRIIRRIEERFTDTTGPENRGPDGVKMLEKIARRRAMFHCLPSEDPRRYLPEHLRNGPEYQTDVPRQVLGELVARLTENPPMIKAGGGGSAATKAAGTKAEEFFNSMWKLVQDQLGIDIMAGLAVGLIRDCYGVLHWNRNPWIYPELDYEYTDELPKMGDANETKAARKKWQKNPEYTEGGKAKRYRESDAALLERRRLDKACAGSPYYFELTDPETFMFVEDRSLLNGFGMVLIRREVGLIDYEESLELETPKLSMGEADDEIHMGEERDAPADYMPSGPDWGPKATLYQLWTRDEFYEVIASVGEHGGSGGWRVVKADKHAWGMPPFAIAPATVVESSDPVMKYEPALEGVYRAKPSYDLYRSLFMVLAQQTAIPEYIIKQALGAIAPLGEDGADPTLSRDASNGDMLPPGAELAKIEFDIKQAFVTALQMMGEDLNEARPKTGRADVSASTQPWAIRLQQAQENVEPARYLKNMARPVNIAIRSIAKDIAKSPDDGGFGEEVVIYKRLDDGEVDYDTLVSVSPDDVRTLDFYVDINATSAQEQITKQEHMRALLNDPKVGMTRREYVEEALMKANPEEYLMDYDTEMMVDQFKQTAVMAKMNAYLATKFMLGPDGQFISMATGQPASPEQVITANGGQPMAQPTPVPMGGQVPGVGQPSMGGLPGLSVPGTMALNGTAV